MNDRKSNTLLNTSIAVTGAAILAILASFFSYLFFKTSLNSPIYYGIVIVLAIASIVFGVVQILPRFFASSKANILEEKESDVDYALLESIRQQTKYEVRGEPQNYPVKVSMEINGTPVTIESSDVGKVEDIMKLLTQVIQASPSIVAETKASQSVVREGKGTYQVDDTSKQT